MKLACVVREGTGALAKLLRRKEAMEDPTIVDLVSQAIHQAKSAQGQSGVDEARREFALAITHLEDARMRINRGFAMMVGKLHDADVEAADTDSPR